MDAKKSGYCFFAITGLTRRLPLTPCFRFYGTVLRRTGRSMNVRPEQPQAKLCYTHQTKRSQRLSEKHDLRSFICPNFKSAAPAESAARPHAGRSLPVSLAIEKYIRFPFLFCMAVHIRIQPADIKTGIQIKQTGPRIIVLSLFVKPAVAVLHSNLL